MHEYEITESIINIIEEEAKSRNITKVSSISLVIGELTSIMDESVQLYFDLLSKGKKCEGAKINFKMITAEFECKSCGKNFRKNNTFKCPICGDDGKPTDIGKEFYIESIEVE